MMRLARAVMAVVVLAAMLAGVSASPAAAQQGDLRCSVRTADGGFEVDVRGASGFERVVVERKVSGRFWWRGIVDASTGVFADGPAPRGTSGVDYRVVAKTSSGSVITTADCTFETTSGLSCAVARTADAYRIDWSTSGLEVDDVVVQRRVSQRFWWRGRVDTSPFIDSSRVRPGVEYRVWGRVDGFIVAAAGCTDGSPPASCVTTADLGIASFPVSGIEPATSQIVGRDGDDVVVIDVNTGARRVVPPLRGADRISTFQLIPGAVLTRQFVGGEWVSGVYVDGVHIDSGSVVSVLGAIDSTPYRFRDRLVEAYVGGQWSVAWSPAAGASVSRPVVLGDAVVVSESNSDDAGIWRVTAAASEKIADLPPQLQSIEQLFAGADGKLYVTGVPNQPDDVGFRAVHRLDGSRWSASLYVDFVDFGTGLGLRVDPAGGIWLESEDRFSISSTYVGVNGTEDLGSFDPVVDPPTDITFLIGWSSSGISYRVRYGEVTAFDQRTGAEQPVAALSEAVGQLDQPRLLAERSDGTLLIRIGQRLVWFDPAC